MIIEPNRQWAEFLGRMRDIVPTLTPQQLKFVKLAFAAGYADGFEAARKLFVPTPEQPSRLPSLTASDAEIEHLS
jgi:hypothetical protein